MARAVKCRRVCCEPASRTFLPEKPQNGMVLLSVEELESLRLCDLEGLDQDTAADHMDVSRGTFQRILYLARHHVAEALVAGKGIRIEGGNYQVAQSPCTCSKACRYCIFASNQ